MKTLEEALESASSLLPGDEENGLKLRNAHDTADDVMNSAAAVDYIMGMLTVRVGREMGNTREGLKVP